MILSDGDLREMIRQGRIVIDPYDERNVQPASIDLRLGGEFMILEKQGGRGRRPEYRKVEGREFELQPKDFVLGTTLEWIELPIDITAFLEGRSSIGRMGLFIHNAGWIDPGFKGNITLELFNASNHPITLEEGMRICQIVFSKVSSPSSGYKGKYLGQRGVTESRIDLDRW